MRVPALPLCASGVSVPTSTKPKPMARSWRGTRAFLSKPAAMPTGLGKSRPSTVWAKRLIVGALGARIEPKLEALDGDVVGALGIDRLQQRLAEPEQPTHAKTPSGRTWRPSGPRASGSLHSTAASSSGA